MAETAGMQAQAVVSAVEQTEPSAVVVQVSFPPACSSGWRPCAWSARLCSSIHALAGQRIP